MSQSPIPAYVAKSNSTNALVPILADKGGLAAMSGGGLSATYNVGAAAVIKATGGRLCKIVVNTAPTSSGALTVNDCATVAAAAAANQIASIPYGSLTAGQVITLDWPCSTGIVISAVGGGTPAYSVSFA